MKKIVIDENNLRKIIRNKLMEQSDSVSVEQKPRCLTNNTIPLHIMVGKSNEFKPYTMGVKKRPGGINGMVDTLGILNNIRLFDDIKDGGEHLSYEMLNHLNQFRNKNYFDETNGGCHKAMDKIIELYKENEHGTELVKDIEKVLALQTKDDEFTPSPRTKEYLKRCLLLIKGK